jgi:hypothetical protein
MMRVPFIAILCIRAAVSADGGLSEFCADRAAMERVYHEQRLGAKLPFEKAIPSTLIEQLVRQDLHKEAVLRRRYGFVVSPAMLAAEVDRITTTTRAPEILAEIRQALGDDDQRFARCMALPILVERELHQRFDSDDQLHHAQRQAAEQARVRLMENQSVPDMRTVTWLLGPRPAEDKPATPAVPPTQIAAKSNSYSNQATAQVSQVITPPAKTVGDPDTVYFEDLDRELQNVLRAQLQKPGSVSAVIETPSAFLTFQVKDKTAEALCAACLTIPKLSYEAWLTAQPNEQP